MPPAAPGSHPADASQGLTIHQAVELSVNSPGGIGFKYWLLDAVARGQFAYSMAASCLIHVAVVFYVGSTTNWRVFVSEVGRNSQAKISREGNNATPKKLEVFLKAVDPTVAENVIAKSPTEVNDPREAVASAVKQETATVPDVIARPDDASAEVEKSTSRPIPQKMERAANQERAVTPDPPRPERAKLDPEYRPKQVQESAASLASVGSLPSRGADVDRPPRPVQNAAPEYPPAALKARQTGRVSVRVRIGVDGQVLKAEIHRSSGVLALDEAALRAVRAWKFEPAQRGGLPTEEEIAVPVKFVIAKPK
jgi:TonB family protein